MNTLFCTPKQGARLKELLPELTSEMVWKFSNWKKTYSQKPLYLDDYLDQFKIPSEHIDLITEHAFNVGLITPALTLQELREVIGSIYDETDIIDEADHILWNGTAPELADWVIARLEESNG